LFLSDEARANKLNAWTVAVSDFDSAKSTVKLASHGFRNTASFAASLMSLCRRLLSASKLAKLTVSPGEQGH